MKTAILYELAGTWELMAEIERLQAAQPAAEPVTDEEIVRIADAAWERAKGSPHGDWAVEFGRAMLARSAQPAAEPLFAKMIAQLPGLAEELKAIAQPAAEPVAWQERQGREPQKQHDNEESANREAERLAKANRGARFIVLRPVREIVVGDVQRIEYDTEDDGLPF